MALSPDFEEIKRAVSLFFDGTGVVELRVPKTRYDGVMSGYFSDPNALAKAALSVAGKAPGIYVTLNPCPEDLLARADNRVKSKADTLTIDREILRRVWLLLDFDPIRGAGISSTNEEHENALLAAQKAAGHLSEEGWPDPVVADSGNGGHLLYRIDLPNDQVSTALIKAVLAAAAQRYGTREVDVDLSVFNASRISKLYGTPAAKGDSTANRPHRLSRILTLPSQLSIVPPDLLNELAAEAKASPPTTSTPRHSGPAGVHREFHLEQWLLEHGVAITSGPVMHDGSEKWVLKHCPFNPEHTGKDAVIFRQASGRLGFKCLHATCAGNDWDKFREFYEPNRQQWTARQQRSGGPAPFAAIPGESDTRDKISTSAADVEGAADAAIAENDIAAAMRLIPALAGLRQLARVVIVAKLRQHFKKSWKDREFTKALNEAVDDLKSSALPPPDDVDGDAAGTEGPDLLFYPLTDAGNGERIVAMFGEDMRYCVEMKCWLVWDGVRWVIDQFDVMRQKVKDMARLLYEQAKRVEKTGVQAHARASEAYGAGTAALAYASTEPGVRISAADLDQHPYLLNCSNGVINLRDGKILRHNRQFLITKLCPIPYLPDAKCPRFIGFLQWAMGANPDAEVSERTTRLVAFLQRAFGYALTGDVTEKAIFICYGKVGNNGKTTLLTLFRDLLGKDYSGQIAIETVMATAKQQDATMRADLADLRGVRLCVTSEVERESKLNEGKIKYITAGSAPIKSCRKYENPIEFWATHKLFMDCNYRPVIRGSDDAIWKRLKLIPFDVQIADAELDKTLPEKLRTEMPGVLAWAVRGTLAWLADGIKEPEDVKAAGQVWREHDDPLKEFFEDCCDIDLDPATNPRDRLFVIGTDLTAAYEIWAKETREKFPLHKEALRERMESKGFKESRSRRCGPEGKQARTWEGLQLKTGMVGAIRGSSVWSGHEER